MSQVDQRLSHQEGELRIGGQLVLFQAGHTIADRAPAPLLLESLELRLQCREVIGRGVHDCNGYRPIASA